MIGKERKVVIEFRKFNNQEKLQHEELVLRRFPLAERISSAFSLETRIKRRIEKRVIQMGGLIDGILFNFDGDTTPPTLRATAVIVIK